MTFVRLQNVSMVHGAGSPWAQTALTNIDLDLEEGDRVLVVGTNGSGKSTLAWLLAGMIEPTRGTARMGARSLVEAQSSIGLLVQQTRLQLLRPTISEELAAFTPVLVDQLDALERMGFSAADLRRRIDDLSVGQQRRIGLAAQLARRTRLLVLDEPMAGLDGAGRSALRQAVQSLPEATAVIIVTHDIEESEALGSRVLQLDAGRLVHDGAAS
jgi:energy-coupling factor transporter ATP-binding protein EcfA2